MAVKLAVGAVIVGAAVAAAILLNIALLGYAQPRNDPVGKLSPRAVFVRGPTAPAPPALPPRQRGDGGEQDD